MDRKTLKIVLPIVALALGAAAAYLLASARKTPPRTERPSLGPLVEVTTVVRSDTPITVAGHGQVGAKVEVEVVPQVAGEVVEVHPSLVAGGFFRAGEALVVIDPRDYELAVNRALAAVARAQVQLEREQAEAEVARQEWDGLNPDEEPPSGLVVREPQVRQAQAELAAAEADLSAAGLDLERTRVTVPFDGIVVSESVDPGQYVAGGRAVATVYGTELVEVRVPLEDRQLAWLEIPKSGDRDGPTAEVSADFAGAPHSWQGRVVRMEGHVDPSTRMVNVVVEVERPFERRGDRPALMPGTFVDVTIYGSTIAEVATLPRHAIREGGDVWVYGDGNLEIREVSVMRSDNDYAYVSSGLADGEQVIVSSLDAVTDGMTVRSTADEDAGGAG